MTKWEYCTLEGIYGDQTDHPALLRMTSNGAELVTSFKDRSKGVNEAQAAAQMLFQLGEDGWELSFGQHVGDLSGATFDDYIWFKRPKS